MLQTSLVAYVWRKRGLGRMPLRAAGPARKPGHLAVPDRRPLGES